MSPFRQTNLHPRESSYWFIQSLTNAFPKKELTDSAPNSAWLVAKAAVAGALHKLSITSICPANHRQPGPAFRRNYRVCPGPQSIFRDENDSMRPCQPHPHNISVPWLPMWLSSLPTCRFSGREGGQNPAAYRHQEGIPVTLFPQLPHWAEGSSAFPLAIVMRQFIKVTSYLSSPA